MEFDNNVGVLDFCTENCAENNRQIFQVEWLFPVARVVNMFHLEKYITM